jgi:hypothetical protein
MLAERAYVHHYARYGVDIDYFEEVMLNSQNTL